MPDRLLLRLALDGSLSWLRQQAGRALPAVATAGPPPAEVLAAAGEVVVLVPAADVLLTSATVQARSHAQRLRALPWAIEEQLLAPVEELHLAAAPDGGDRLGVGVVARARLQDWLARLAAAGIEPDALLPESLALPLSDGTASLLLEEAGACLRLGNWSALVAAPGELGQVLARLAAADRPARLLVNDLRRDATPLAAAVPVELAPRTEALAWLAGGLGALPLNLLQGEFAPQRRRGRIAPWRLAAALVAAALLLAVLNLGVDVLRLQRQVASLDAQAAERVLQAFPDVTPEQLARMGPEALMRARLERLRGGEGGGLLRLLGEIAPVVATTPRAQTRSVSYRNGVVELGLRSPDVPILDGVRERLALVPGLQVELVQANPDADGVDGRLRIGGSAR